MPKHNKPKPDNKMMGKKKKNGNGEGMLTASQRKLPEDLKKKINSKTTLYDTGICLDIPVGYYVEIVPRSSIVKSGYMLSNSIGIIDCSYKGNLYVGLTKICDDAIEIEYPFK